MRNLKKAIERTRKVSDKKPIVLDEKKTKARVEFKKNYDVVIDGFHSHTKSVRNWLWWGWVVSAFIVGPIWAATMKHVEGKVLLTCAIGAWFWGAVFTSWMIKSARLKAEAKGKMLLMTGTRTDKAKEQTNELFIEKMGHWVIWFSLITFALWILSTMRTLQMINEIMRTLQIING